MGKTGTFRRFSGLALALLSGCATVPHSLPTGVARMIEPGPDIELLRHPTSKERVIALIDRGGLAHVLIAAASAQTVEHVTVAPTGALTREQVPLDASPASLSAAFDHDGRLHLLLDDLHWVREPSGWVGPLPTPWSEIGLRVKRPRVLFGQDGPIWLMTVDGRDIGMSGRWEWFLIGGPAAAILLPWHVKSEKLLVVMPDPRTHAQRWHLIDGLDEFDAVNISATVDAEGNLHIVYDASTVAFGVHRSRHLRLARQPASSPENPRLIKGTGTPLENLQGTESACLSDPRHRGLDDASLASDPVSGNLLLVRPHSYSLQRIDGRWSEPQELPLDLFWSPRLAPAGGNSFHMMTISQAGVAYLNHAEGAWSAPVMIGDAGLSSSWGNVFGALGFASDGGRRAFAVWPTPSGIVGRWIMGPPSPPEASDAPSPRSLLPLNDFLRGKAALSGGFTEANTAAGHNWITKCLHDEGHWEQLAGQVLTDQWGDNLRWYYLGRAAEGMGLCDAAERYYLTSRERSEKFPTRCLGKAGCQGFDFPEVLAPRLASIETMRAGGQCVPPR
jgi:hypothetical protein